VAGEAAVSAAQGGPRSGEQGFPGIGAAVTDPDATRDDAHLGGDLQQLQPDGLHLGAGLPDPGRVRSASSSAPVAYGSLCAAARPGPSFVGARTPSGSYMMTGLEKGAGHSDALNWSHKMLFATRVPLRRGDRMKWA